MRPDHLLVWLFTAAQLRLAKVASGARDRGDVPGWVMVTVMSAGLVVAVFAIFRDAIINAVSQAFEQVGGSTGVQ